MQCTQPGHTGLTCAMLLVVFTWFIAACGGSGQDECPKSRVAECDGNTAKVCLTKEDGGTFGNDILVWDKETCDGPTPHCRHFHVSGGTDEEALCSATEDKVCGPDDREVCVNGNVFSCHWGGYPIRREEVCDGPNEECVRVDDVRAECRSTTSM
jgi:hypothetical protein